MQILVLGGTAWLGRELARQAVDLGHDVTCLARGVSGAVPPRSGFVRADRAEPGAYDQVSGQSWDVVIDVSRQPGQVRDAVTALVRSAARYVFVSTGNVYADHRTPGQDEDSPLLPPSQSDVLVDMETYGEAKVACEEHVLTAFGAQRSLIARAGLIGGPGDISDRSGYWPLRFARPAASDGAALVPDAPELSAQLIDVRDLAAWLLSVSSRGVTGVFNATGETLPLSAYLDSAREVAGHSAPLVPAESRWLLDAGVEPWMGERSLPLWLPDPAWQGFTTRDSSRARRAGLVASGATALAPWPADR